MSLPELRQTIPITDEKLEEYLGIWNTLIDQGHRKMLDITLYAYYEWHMFHHHYTLTYGEEKRELTYEQALRVKEWLDSTARLT